MRNLIYGSLVFITLMFSSCVEEDKLFSLDDFPTGALPNFSQGPGDDGFIGLGRVEEFQMEVQVDFANYLQQSADGGKTSQGSGRTTTNLEFSEVRMLDIEVMWTDASSGQSYTGTLGNTTSWPVTLTFSGMDIVNAISQLTSPDSLGVGDIVTVAGGIHFQDGRHSPAFILNPSKQPVLAYSPTFFNHPGYSPILQYTVNCVSELGVEVNYEVLEAVDAYGAVLAPPPGTFTWASNSNGNYSWPTYTFGLYQNAYGCCEQTAASPLRILEVCGDLSMTAADGYGCDWKISVDEINGPDLTVTLSGGCLGFVTLRMTRTDGQTWPPLF